MFIAQNHQKICMTCFEVVVKGCSRHCRCPAMFSYRLEFVLLKTFITSFFLIHSWQLSQRSVLTIFHQFLPNHSDYLKAKKDSLLAIYAKAQNINLAGAHEQKKTFFHTSSEYSNAERCALVLWIKSRFCWMFGNQ